MNSSKRLRARASLVNARAWIMARVHNILLLFLAYDCLEMPRKLLFVLCHDQPDDDLTYILRIAQSSLPEKGIVNIKILLLKASYLWDSNSWDDFNEDWKHVKMGAELDKILDSGAEVAYDNKLEYPRWEGPFDLSIPGMRDNATEYGKAIRFRESGIKIVDRYEYVADAVSKNFDIIKW